MRRIVVAGRLGQGRALPDELLAADQLVRFATIIEATAFVVAAVLLLRWQVVAHRNLAALGGKGSRPGLGVGSWFVPGVNLVEPFRLLARLWRAGEPGRPLPWLLPLWWGAWLVALAAVVATWALFGEAADVAERERIDTLRAGATVFAALAAGLAIAVLTRISARQERRALELGSPRGAAGRLPAESVSEGGLRVVSEERAQGLQHPDDAR